MGVGGIVLPKNGELNDFFLPLDEAPGSIGEPIKRGKSQMRQLPSQVIQTRPEAVNEIAKEHRDRFVDWGNINPKDVQSLIKICLFRDGVMSRIFKPSINFSLKGVEMFLCPSGLHFDIYQPSNEILHANAPAHLANEEDIGILA
jgi:hypothetical protein